MPRSHDIGVAMLEEETSETSEAVYDDAIYPSEGQLDQKRLSSLSSYESGGSMLATLHSKLADTVSELRMQIMDERDTFLYEYDQLEQELFDTREMMGRLQHQLEEAHRRWEYERTMKLQLEQQLIYSSPSMNLNLTQQDTEQEDTDCNEDMPDEKFENQGPESSSKDQRPGSSLSDADQPSTPPGNEGFEGNMPHRISSTTGSSMKAESLSSCVSDPAYRPITSSQAQAEELALEAQIALAKLREEHRQVIDELIMAKLQIADLRTSQGPRSDLIRPTRRQNFEDTHFIARGLR